MVFYIPYGANTYKKINCFCNNNDCRVLTLQFREMNDARGHHLKISTSPKNESPTMATTTMATTKEFNRRKIIWLKRNFPKATIHSNSWVAMHHFCPEVIEFFCQQKSGVNIYWKWIDLIPKGFIFLNDKSFVNKYSYDKNNYLCVPSYGLDSARDDLVLLQEKVKIDKKNKKIMFETEKYIHFLTTKNELTPKDRRWEYRFSANARKEMKKGKISFLKQKRLEQIGFDFFPKQKNKNTNWARFLEQFDSAENNVSELEDFANLLKKYDKDGKPGKVLIRADDYKSIQQLVVTSMKVYDVDPNDCTRDAPISSVQHTLSYVVQPHSGLPVDEDGVARKMKPDEIHYQVETKRFRTKFFGKEECARFPDLLEMMQRFVRDCPAFIKHLYNNNQKWSKEDLEEYLVKEITRHEHVFFDPFPVPNGSNYKDGKTVITRTKQPGPRRLNLHDRLGEPKYSKLLNCTTYSGFVYTLSFCEPYQYYGKALCNYESIAALKLEVWKHVFDHLTPISKVCPPNGVNVLTYFSCFGSRINPHKDMNPSMAVDSNTNSQILGSNVVVISFFSSMNFLFTDIAKATKNQTKPKVLLQQLTEHCSIYVLSPWDDVEYYHKANFTNLKGRKNTDVRVCLTLRWLSRRVEFVGDDYSGRMGDRRHQVIYPNIRKRINKQQSNAKRKYLEDSIKRQRITK